jgi:hypothetical protein
MSQIKIVDQAFEELATLESVISAARTEKINSDNLLNLTFMMKTSASANVNAENLYELDSDYFDLARYNKGQQSDGKRLISIETEHVSYRLNNPDYDKAYFTEMGTPTYILGKILQGTGFTVGTVEYTDVVTYSTQKKMSRRQILMEFVAYLGGEVLFEGFTVSIVQYRGNQTARELVVGYHITVLSKDLNKRETNPDTGDPKICYACEIVRNLDPPLALGDKVTIDYDDLDIDIELRVVSITYDPYNPNLVKPQIEIGNYINSLEDDLYRIETTTVGIDQYYNNCRIGPTYGFEAILSTNWARAYFCSTAFAMQVGDGTGNTWTNAVYFDPVNHRYVFNGDIVLEDGVITWNKLDQASANSGVTTIAEDWISTRKIKISELTSINEANPIIFLFTHEGVAQAGTDGTITLANTASTTDDIYNGMTIDIISGTGSGQSKTIIDYSGSVRITYVDSDWTTNPDETSVYRIRGQAIDGTANNEEGVGDAIRLKYNRFNYLRYAVDRCDFYFATDNNGNRPNIRPNGFYVGDTAIFTWNTTCQVIMQAFPQVWVDTEEPAEAKINDLWVDTDDYSRYDILDISTNTTLTSDVAEIITASGTISITLHAASAPGIIKRIINKGTGLVTLIGTINGLVNMYLYPGESIELITDGADWRG